MKNRRALLPVLLCAAALATLPACDRGASTAERTRDNGPAEFRLEQPAMGTMFEYVVLGMDAEKAREAVFQAHAEVLRLEELMSTHDQRPGSDLNRIAKAAGGAPVAVAPETLEVIRRSLEIGRQSGGAFDITVAALRGIWSSNPEHPLIPTEAQLAERLPLIDYRQVTLDDAARTVRLARPGMRIDLGGIAKGYAVDRAAAVLRAKGITMASVNAGGNLMAIGRHGDRPWRVGIQDPRGEGTVGEVELTDRGIGTAGDYQRFIMHGGRRLCHIVDPKTGRSVEHTQSVTIVAPDAFTADAYDTAVFVMGAERGMALVEAHPELQALIIDAQGGRHESSRMRGEIHYRRSEP